MNRPVANTSRSSVSGMVVSFAMAACRSVNEDQGAARAARDQVCCDNGLS